MERGAALAREILDTRGVTSGYRAWASNLIAEFEMEHGDLATAEAMARAALDPTSSAAVRRLLAVTTLARTLARRGRASEGVPIAEEGLAWLTQQRAFGYTELPIRLAVAEARRAAGDARGADEALEIARERLRVRASAIPDPGERARYLAASTFGKWVTILSRKG